MKQKHVVVFVHGWNGKPWLERFFRTIPEWQDSIYLPYSWGLPGKNLGIAISKWQPDHFNESKNRAVQNAIYLNRMLNLIDAESIDVVAHSMGAHIVHEALRLKTSAPINNIYLFAGALPRAKSWYRILDQIDGQIFNFSSKHDKSLKGYCVYLGTNKKWNGGTIGLPTKGNSEAARGISTRLAKIHNIDVSNLNLGHSDYYSKLNDLIHLTKSVPNRGSEDAMWQSKFYWDPTPQFYVSGKKYIRGAKCELVQVGLQHHFKDEHKLEVTGYPDEPTVGLVKLFQRQKGLKADGIVGPKTWSLLIDRSVDWL